MTPALVWNDAMLLKQPRMDATHREFVDLLAALDAALDHEPDELAPRFTQLLDHTVEHFAQEERWMAAIGFAPENFHAFQHKHVLDVLREVKGVIGSTGDAQILRRLISELAAWFPAHAQMMDAALAETMQACGYDTETGALARPLPSASEPITGCGSSSCS
jgi:hemerythrin-like metal-binding protein